MNRIEVIVAIKQVLPDTVCTLNHGLLLLFGFFLYAQEHTAASTLVYAANVPVVELNWFI